MWTLLFDIDGTLIRTNSGMKAMGQAVTQHYGVTEIPEIRVHGCTDRGIVNELFSALNLSLDGDRSDFLATYFEFLERRLNQVGGEVLPGVVELLDSMAQREDVALGILTGNARRAAEIKLAHFELDQYFAFGGYGDDSPDRNDVAAAAVTAARRALGDAFDESKVWVLGDTINDIRCARSVGAKALAVETGGDCRETLDQAAPDFLLNSFEQASSWVATIAPSKQ